jgi:hypothetical protein
VRVSVLYFTACPNWQEAGRRVRLALDRIGGSSTVTFVPVDTDTQAEALGFPGSPTITVDGVDLFPNGPRATGLNCRVYPTATGMAGVPEVTDLVTALRERAPAAPDCCPPSPPPLPRTPADPIMAPTTSWTSLACGPGPCDDSPT